MGLNKASMLTLNTVMLYFLFYQTFIDHYKKEYASRILNAICAIVIIQLSMITLQYFNEFLQVWVEQGIIGFGIVAGFIMSLLFKFKKARTWISKIAVMGLVVVMINSGVNFLMHTTVGVLFFVYLGILEKEGGLINGI